MGGKIDSTSKSAYQDNLNENIINKTFMSQRVVVPENEEEKKSDSFYLRSRVNSTKRYMITKHLLEISDSLARLRFKGLTKNFEEQNNLQLSGTSKIELLYGFLDYVEETFSLVCLKDDAVNFDTHKFKFPDIMKLYLYKMLYPRIFDFEPVPNGCSGIIKFRSDFIEENFEKIYKQVELLCLAIVYDAMLIAIETLSFKYIKSLKKDYDEPINPKQDVPVIQETLHDLFADSKDGRSKILNLFSSSAIFFAKHHFYLYGGKKDDNDKKNATNRDIDKILITRALKSDTFFSGSRSRDSKRALTKSFNECIELFSRNPSFEKLLNLYYINKRSHLFDLNIIKTNVEFAPYLLDGIITKHFLHSIIIDNCPLIDDSLPENLQLKSVYNSPNCIIENLSSRDYETLDFIISHTAKTMQLYYFQDADKDAFPKRIEEILEKLTHTFYSSEILRMIEIDEILDIDTSDYDRVMYYRAVSKQQD
ncbi:MAG: hypothetical protein E7406_01160 [Ruminococcaceae bacterium]|nr:hypothetical protein [Oscillospiraceae bacterium]